MENLIIKEAELLVQLHSSIAINLSIDMVIVYKPVKVMGRGLQLMKGQHVEVSAES